MASVLCSPINIKTERSVYFTVLTNIKNAALCPTLQLFYFIHVIFVLIPGISLNSLNQTIFRMQTFTDLEVRTEDLNTFHLNEICGRQTDAGTDHVPSS